MEYKYLDHTADAKFKAFGQTLEEAFINSANATFGLLISPKDVKAETSHELNIKSNRLESLLYDFIEELLFMLDVDGFLLSKIESLIIKKTNTGYQLLCTVFGDSYKNYEISGNIKSVTYSNMEIKKTKDGFEITVVLDI